MHEESGIRWEEVDYGLAAFHVISYRRPPEPAPEPAPAVTVRVEPYCRRWAWEDFFRCCPAAR